MGNATIMHTIQEEDLQAGDHIYVWRIGFEFQRHGIYVGCGEVIQLACLEDTLGNDNHITKSEVHKLSLLKFSGGGTLKKVKYSTPYTEYLIKVSGSCQLLNSDSAEKVIERANKCLGCRIDLFKFNGESFALWCKTSVLRIPRNTATPHPYEYVDNPFNLPNGYGEKPIYFISKWNCDQKPSIYILQCIFPPTYFDKKQESESAIKIIGTVDNIDILDQIESYAIVKREINETTVNLEMYNQFCDKTITPEK